MIPALMMIACILYIALQLEDKLKIPTPLGLIALSFFAHIVFRQAPFITSDANSFSALVIFMLPILLISDSLELRLADLKKHLLSLLYLAVVAVVLSILLGLLVADWIFADYHLSKAAVVVLFAMVLATDPVSVVSIFSKFKLPHRLKFLAEGESLFNDATALVVFVFIGLYALGGGEITGVYIAQTSLLLIFGSVVVGTAVGYVALLLMKTTENRMAEMMVLIITGYSAFELAEHFYVILNLFGLHSHMHLSGILACIFATLTVNHVICKEIDAEAAQIDHEELDLQAEAQKANTSTGLFHNLFLRVKATISERERHLRTKEDVQLLAIVANTVLFVAMAEMINIGLLWQYRVEIIAMFIATTLIRVLVMQLFSWLSYKTEKIACVSIRWSSVLTFAGIKGGLSIVMLAMIPSDFEHLEMFKAVVIGVIILSTFVYSAALILIINRYQDIFIQEKQDPTNA